MEEATNESKSIHIFLFCFQYNMCYYYFLVLDGIVPAEICEPVLSLADLWSVVENPPKWIQRIVDLSPRGPTVIQNIQNDCHVGIKDFVPKVRLDRNSTPRTLVCHDMMNGYLEDKYVKQKCIHLKEFRMDLF